MKLSDIHTPIPEATVPDCEQLALFTDTEFIERLKHQQPWFSMSVHFDGPSNSAAAYLRVLQTGDTTPLSSGELHTVCPMSDHTIRALVAQFAQTLVNVNASVLPF